MSNLVYILFIIGFLIIVTILIFKEITAKRNYIEGFKKEIRREVVMFGDSILDNSNYVKNNKTVEAVLKNPNKYGFGVKNFAQDDAIIEDMNEQFNGFVSSNTISKKKKKNISRNGMFFISLGGNDLLREYHDNPSDVKNMEYFDSIWKEYKEMIEIFEKDISEISTGRYKDVKIGLIGLYLPVSNRYKNYDKIVSSWNRNLKNFSKKSKRRVYVELYKHLNQNNHFVDNIEPSKKGSEIIAKQINLAF
jgi:hypothetical protein